MLDLETIPFVESKGSRLGKYEDRELPIELLIFHSTGAGLWKRWARDNRNYERLPLPDYSDPPQSWSTWRKRRGKEPYPFDTALRVYGSLMNAGPHFVVCGETGRIAQVCSIEKCAWHVGSIRKWPHRRKYENGSFLKTCPWWGKKWPMHNSPLDFLGGTLWRDGKTVNRCSIGVEIAPPRDGVCMPLSSQCLASLLQLRCELGRRKSLVGLTHADVHPLSRTSRGRPTDLNEVQWPSELALKML